MADFTESEQKGFRRDPGEREYGRASELREVLRSFLHEGDRITREWGLTRQRFDLLLAIRTSRDGTRRATQQELIERLLLAQSSVVELIDRSEDAGLVGRVPGGGRRQVLVTLTAEGERRLAGAVGELRRHRRRLLSLLERVR